MKVKGDAALGAGADDLALEVLGLPPLKLHLTFIAYVFFLKNVAKMYTTRTIATMPATVLATMIAKVS